jgi:hypothetical protein
MKYLILVSSALIATACSHKTIADGKSAVRESTNTPFKSCPDDSERMKLRSDELQEIVKADQADRQPPISKIDWNKVMPADEARAKRVAEIFAEGCFKEAKDYAAAALVFQHGTVPDHYYQAYLWSKKALELGDEKQKLMIANTVDRYLINLGYKQLFGAQSFGNGPNGCHCIAPVETKFSDKLRMKISGRTLNNRLESLRESNKGNPACSKVVYCDKDLKTPPKGLFPGIW